MEAASAAAAPPTAGTDDHGLKRAISRKAAGAALYINRAFGIRFLTFMVAFAVMCSGLTSAATLSRAFGGDYLSEFISVPTIVVAFLLLLAVAALSSRGIGES